LTLPHLLKRIHLQLARSKEFPMGSRRRGYEFVAPLDAAGHIDPRLWHQYRDHCRVRRFWEGEDEQVGRLVHKPGGAEHARWVFDTTPSGTTTMRRAIASVPTRSHLASTYRSARDAHLSGGVGAAGVVIGTDGYRGLVRPRVGWNFYERGAPAF
jgi:hypothetical protein